MATAPDVDAILEKLLAVKNRRPGTNVQLTEAEITFLCTTSREIFINQPNLLDLEAPLQIVGDIHAQYTDLLRLFEFKGFPPEANYLFLGDYVDRGSNGLECICLLLAYKIKYPENFFMIRGNHECAAINRIYGFYDECKRRYSVKLWKKFQDVFNVFPLAAVVDEKIFCIHGGLSPDLVNTSQINKILRPTDVPDTGARPAHGRAPPPECRSRLRGSPCCPPGLLCDILWSDPDKDANGWSENDRGVSYTFGQDVVAKFLQKNDFDLIVRAHQVRAAASPPSPCPSPGRSRALAHLPRRWWRTGTSFSRAASW